ncbi:WAP four-disulfide core domain protein 2 isoform X1 [Physeter macrocephalus]|uniref:WAP four-disulfide core domain protein 2 n=1 Tax=Physeter macrocephalus TaxID=9755 RepID=A0A2Y9T0C5_PHYMC|nr:WAP four-disulfide core domain protein 2 isoform X1 [Physeter catodon]|eukprot:XP_023984356.1 WAP four-disulfide core domain protein 2 isoform X1 [Physeter catodon]
MPTCRLGLLVAALLLGLLLGLPPVTGTGAEKSGVCPALEVDLNCTQECLSDGECADNLKCCRAGCATVCHMPNAKFHFSTGKTESPVLSVKERLHQPAFLDMPQEDEWYQDWQNSREPHFRRDWPGCWHQNQELLHGSFCF